MTVIKRTDGLGGTLNRSLKNNIIQIKLTKTKLLTNTAKKTSFFSFFIIFTLYSVFVPVFLDNITTYFFTCLCLVHKT